MKLIPLSKGMFAMVDDEDFEYLSQFKWQAKVKKRTTYAERNIYLGKIDGKYRNSTISIHVELMERHTPGLKGIRRLQKLEVDHIDHNGLNCQKLNLRVGKKENNQSNRNKTLSKTTSIYKGVSLMKVDRPNKWRALINASNKTIQVGVFDSELNAAIAYNVAAFKHHGEFAQLNQLNY